MADNMNLRGDSERHYVGADRPQEVDDLRRKFGVTTQRIIDAIREVGNNRELVENYLRQHSGESPGTGSRKAP